MTGRSVDEPVPPCVVCSQISGAQRSPGGVASDGTVATYHLPPASGERPCLGHLLVCPVRHAGNFGALTAVEAASVGKAIRVAHTALTRSGAVHVYMQTIGHAIDHLHVHMMPRWPDTPPDLAWHLIDEWPQARRADDHHIEAMMEVVRDESEPAGPIG